MPFGIDVDCPTHLTGPRNSQRLYTVVVVSETTRLPVVVLYEIVIQVLGAVEIQDAILGRSERDSLSLPHLGFIRGVSPRDIVLLALLVFLGSFLLLLVVFVVGFVVSSYVVGKLLWHRVFCLFGVFGVFLILFIIIIILVVLIILITVLRVLEIIIPLSPLGRAVSPPLSFTAGPRSNTMSASR
ncbi:hypothetical protein BJX66DRAFT_318590 [Aspergillus keveii]|uniref:Uncharacterized protein n=1 Tax=Aspergillus keveii TaxID=714993 RepID=A0ABR4FJG5_9EURO